jgi:hypothetical protein
VPRRDAGGFVLAVADEDEPGEPDERVFVHGRDARPAHRVARLDT